MIFRSIRSVVDAIRTYEGAGFLVQRPFPSQAFAACDPFLLLDEMGPMDVEPGEAKGAPDHPHRGFETVTYLLSGSMEHKDSQGHAGRLTPGDVQWMTAGSGVIHSELPSEALMQEGGRLHGFQLWVNLPRVDKMMKPRYQEIPLQKIPTATSADGLVMVRVLAGESLGVKAAIDTRTPIMYVHARIQPGGRFEQAVPESFNAFAYVIDGAGLFGADERVGRDAQAIVFANDGDAVVIDVPASAKDSLDVLLVAGVPLNEPIVRYGPFVMNTDEEIEQAFADFRAGTFGEILS